MSLSSTRPTVAVIGSGPYGLAVGAHLRHAGLDVRILGEPMALWRQNMPVGMYLKSEPSASNIATPCPGLGLDDYCRSIGVTPLAEEDPIPIELFTGYGEWFQHHHVPVEREQVTEVARSGRGFSVALASGERFDTGSVVVASGHLRYAWTPPEYTLPGFVSHPSEHRDLSTFAGKTVAVIGAGQSALESAALLNEAGATVHLLVRKPEVLWAGPPEPEPRPLRQRALKPGSPMGPGWSHVLSHRGAAAFRHLPARTRLALVRIILGPAGAWWLRDRVDGTVDIRTSFTIRSLTVTGDQVVIDATTPTGATKLVVDHVLAATGYHVDVDRLEFLEPSIRSVIARTGGSPALDAGFQTSVPGIYFSGLASAATFGPLMRFVCGTEFAAPRLAAAVAAR